MATQVDERVVLGETPQDYVRRLAACKARAAADLLKAPGPGTIAIAADTAVVDRVASEDGVGWRDVILGKPANDVEAETMLRFLRGRTHQVYTGLAALRIRDGKLLSEVCCTDVPMRAYSDEEMLAYIASGDPLDKAGAYAIQHQIFKPVECMQGCYANVMGLPLCHLARLLAELELFPSADIPASCRENTGYACEIYRRVLNLGDS